jgi:hypothetical protein
MSRVFGSITVNQKTVVQSMQDCIRDIVAMRLAQLNYEQIVANQIESRIAYAISSREHAMVAAIQKQIESQVAKRVADVVSGLTISANVTVHVPCGDFVSANPQA